MSESRFGRHPNVAGVFAVGVGTVLLSMVVYWLSGDVDSPFTTVAFLLALFGIGLTMVSGMWYVSLFVRDFLYG